MSSALTGAVRTGGDRGLFEYAPASIDVNESGEAWRRALTSAVRDKPALCNRVRRRMFRCHRRVELPAWVFDPIELGRVGRNDSLLQHKAAVEAPFAGLDHAIGFLRALIEGKSLDRAHR
jgi:hypothetical protein